MPNDASDSLRARALPRQGERPWLSRVLVFATVIMLVDALVGDRGLVASLRAREDYARTRWRLQALRHENSALREQAERLTSDRRAIESLVRKELGFVRPGETLFIVSPLMGRMPAEPSPAR